MPIHEFASQCPGRASWADDMLGRRSIVVARLGRTVLGGVVAGSAFGLVLTGGCRPPFWTGAQWGGNFARGFGDEFFPDAGHRLLFVFAIFGDRIGWGEMNQCKEASGFDVFFITKFRFLSSRLLFVVVLARMVRLPIFRCDDFESGVWFN